MITIERSGKWIAIILFFMIAAILMVFLYDFYSIITKSTKTAEEEYLMQNTRTNAIMIREKIQGDLDTVYALSSLFSSVEHIDSTEARLLLEKAGKELPFTTLMVKLSNGEHYTSNGAEIDTGHPQYLRGNAKKSKRIEVIYKNALFSRDMIALESPIIQEGQTIGKVSGLYYSNYINNILDYAGAGSGREYQIIDRSGDFILSSKSSVFHQYQSLYHFLSDVSFPREGEESRIISDFMDRKSGVVSYIENGRSNIFCYMPIGVMDWYLISTAPETVINFQMLSIKNPAIMLALRVIILFVILILFIVWRQVNYRVITERNRVELERLNERLKIKNALLQSKAENDLLTGLYNKVTSELAIGDYLANEGKDGRHALFIIDMDDFKKINDELGHFYGDKTITDAADGIDHCLRTTDIKGRIGGDEFMVLLKNVPQDQAIQQKAAEICRAFEATEIVEGSGLRLSGSIGIAIYPDHADNFRGLYQKADRAMYYAKKHGKGTYCIYDNYLEKEKASQRFDRKLIVSKKGKVIEIERTTTGG